MIPLPERAPNVHPLIVHFPIALLFSAALFDLIGLLARNWWRSSEVAGSLNVLGALAAIVTYFTGQAAGDAVSIPSGAQTILTDHADWAARTVWFYGLYGVVRVEGAEPVEFDSETFSLEGPFRLTAVSDGGLFPRLCRR